MLDELERELKRINDFDKIPANGSKKQDEFTSKSNQNQRLSFRVTADSHQLIHDMAKRRNLSMADMSKSIMALGLKKNFETSYKLAITVDIMDKLSELVYQVQSLGNNINQLARSNHSFNKHTSLLDLSKSTVTEHDRMNKDIHRLSQSVDELSREMNLICQQLAK